MRACMCVCALMEALTAMFSSAPQDGLTPLHIASVEGHAEVVAALLAKGADVEAKTNVRTS